ncbi:MAG: protein kinase, partial [Acidobacteriota bacterium]
MQIGIPEIEQKYELLEKLGEGGMGSVYKARHRLLEEVRVIKTVKPQLQQDEDLQNRFRREAQVAAKMRHPHIATLYDAEVLADGSAYLVMDFIAGENIRDYVRKGGGLTLQQVVDIGRQGLSALAYLHGQSFVHRDISSDNMMLSWQDGEPHVTLIDLGLAKNLGGSQWQTKTGMVVGKVRYISPEQLNSGFDGAEVDARSDLYSFGVVLYELLTGEYPIVGQDDMSLIAGHLYREPRPFDETDPNSKIPPALRSVVLKALEKKRGDRFASAGDLSEALGKALESYFTQPVQLPPDEQPTVQLSGGRVAEAAQGAGASPEVAGRGLVDVRSPGGETRATHRASDAETARVGGAGRQTVPVDMDAETAPIFLPPGSTAAVPPPDGTTADTRAHGPAPAEAKSPGSKKGLAAAAVLVLALVGAWVAGVFDRSDRDSVASSPATAPEGASAADATGEGVFFGQFHALVIGIDNYQQLPRLETAISDA